MEKSLSHFRRTAVAAGAAIALCGAALVGATAFAAPKDVSTSNPILLNDERHFPAPLEWDPSRAPVVVRVGGGFDWLDAAVGAAAGFGLALVFAGAMSELRGRISPARGSTQSNLDSRIEGGLH